RIVENVSVVDHFDVLGVTANFGDRFLDGHLGRNANVARMHQSGGFIFRVKRPATFAAPFGNDGYFQIASLIENLICKVAARKRLPGRIAGGADKNLRNSIAMRVFHEGVGGLVAIYNNRIDAERFSEPEVPLDGLTFRCRKSGEILAGGNEDGRALRVE